MNSSWFRLLVFGIILWCSCGTLRFSSYSTLDHLLQQDTLLHRVRDSFSKYESQIIYTQIDRDKNNKPHFKSFSWDNKPTYYFYPASMVKMPAALLAAEKINHLSKYYPQLNVYSPVRYEAGHTPQSSFSYDSLSSNHQASLAQFIKRIFIVSDNEAFNRTYEFIGQAELNKQLRSHGYLHTHIIHRLDVPDFNYETNKYTNPLTFAEEDRMIYSQKEQYNPEDIRVTGLQSLKKGVAYISNDRQINEPFDFSLKNYFALQDMSDMIQSIMFPGSVSSIRPFDLSPDQLEYIRLCMSKLPRESRQPVYDSTHYDGYCKFFMFGDTKTAIPDQIRIFNKVGWAYGYLTDAAYIVDFKNKIEFILAATINTNTDGIFNDGKYEYETIGLPYLSKLGRMIYNHELQRKRNHTPDLKEFKLNYQE